MIKFLRFDTAIVAVDKIDSVATAVEEDKFIIRIILQNSRYVGIYDTTEDRDFVYLNVQKSLNALDMLTDPAQ